MNLYQILILSLALNTAMGGNAYYDFDVENNSFDPESWPQSRSLERIQELHAYNDRFSLNHMPNKVDLLSVVKPGGVVMDIGVGEGAFLLDVKKVRKDIFTIGITNTLLPKENASKIQNLFYCNFPECPSLDRSIEQDSRKADLIIDTYGALTYSDNPLKVLIKIAFLMRPGGYFSAITSADPHLVDGSVFGNEEERERLCVFFKKHLGIELHFEWTMIRSEINERGTLVRDLKISFVGVEVPRGCRFKDLIQRARTEVGDPVQEERASFSNKDFKITSKRYVISKSCTF